MRDTENHVPTTTSGIPLRSHYGPDDVPSHQTAAATSRPGAPPFLRGSYPEMYRTKPWRIFQLSGFGNPADMNARLKFLLDAGETGIIVKQDRMTDDHLYDVDHPDITERREDVGLTGTVTVGLRDYETIMDGIPIESVYTKPGAGVVQSAPYTLSCFWSVAQRRGIPLDRLRGTGQSDYFLTYVGCPTKEQIPPEAGLRFNLDIIEFCSEYLPNWVPVSIAGYNGADSGLNVWQELGAVFANAVVYLDAAKQRGITDLTTLARKIGGMNFRTTTDLFEDAAKLRTARKMWHDLVTKRYGITDDRAAALRIHIVTAGSYMTYQEPLNNIVRGTIMALSAVLGGTQSLGVSGYDEAMSIPSDHADLMSIRIQQILQEETGLTSVSDPLGGSYFVESLCADLEERAWAFFEQIQGRGGFLATIDDGWLMGQAGESQEDFFGQIQRGERRIVGVNAHAIDDPMFHIDGFTGTPGAEVWEKAMKRLDSLRRERDGTETIRALKDLEATCHSDRNIVPSVMAAVQADASIGEIGGVFREAFGVWDTPVRF